MNNKGFTLVELLAVMLILIAISLVAVGGISSSLEKRDEKENELLDIVINERIKDEKKEKFFLEKQHQNLINLKRKKTT